jgi:hypothetical protein
MSAAAPWKPTTFTREAAAGAASSVKVTAR